MNNTIKMSILFCLITIINICCDKNKTTGSDESSTQEIIFTTSNVNLKDIYFNLIDGVVIDQSNQWHFVINTDSSNYNMPGILMGNVSIAIYTELEFNEIIDIPSTFNEDSLIEKDVFRYEQEHEVFSYNMEIHKVSVSNPGYIYILKDAENGIAFKIQFLDYISGIIVFKYSLICEDC